MMNRCTPDDRSTAGWLLIDTLVGVLMLVIMFWTVGLFALRERELVDQRRRVAAMDALLAEQIERLRARPFASLRLGKDQPISLEGLDERLLRDVTCRLDIAPYRPDTPDLLAVTVRVTWTPGHRYVAKPLTRSMTTLVARRDYGEGD